MNHSLSELISFLKQHPSQPWFPDAETWVELADKILLIPYWDSGESFQQVLILQHALRDFLRHHPLWHFHLIGHHPACLTMGRGMQKGLPSNISLQPTPLPGQLPVTLYTIERGGDLTFHFPGQMIWYHLAKLHPERWPLNRHLDHLMQTTVRAVENLTAISLQAQRNPLGLWLNGRKLASIGIGVTHHITTHGLALNVHWQGIDKSILQTLNPCGLSSNVYQALSDLRPDPPHPCPTTHLTSSSTPQGQLTPKILGQEVSRILSMQ